MGKTHWIFIALFLVLLFSIVFSGLYAAQTNTATIEMRHPARSEPVLDYAVIRTSLILTTSYVDTSYVDISGAAQLGIFFDITQGSLTSFEYKLWWSPNGVDWFCEVTESVSSGAITLNVDYYTMALTGDVKFHTLCPFRATYFKLQVKGTGTVTGNLCEIKINALYN